MYRLFYNIISISKIYISASPLLVNIFISLFAKDRKITDRENIDVSGPPRVSNTYVGRVLNQTQEDLHFVNHFHSPGQVINGLKKGIPTIIIIRDPLDTAISSCIKYPLLYPFVAVLRYNVFYNSLLKYKGKYIVADFKIVKSDFNSIIREFNEKYQNKLRLKYIENPDILEGEILESMFTKNTPEGDIETQVSAPTKKKEMLKKEMTKSIEATFNMSKAKQIYNIFKKKL